MSVEFTVRGVRAEPVTDSVDFAQLYGADVGYLDRGRVQVGGIDRGAAEPVNLPGDDDDVVEIEDAEGVVTFTRARTLADQAGGDRSGGSDVIDITAYLQTQTSRDGAQLGSVRRYGISLPPEVGRAIGEIDGAVRDAGALSGFLDGGTGMIAGLLPQELFNGPAALAARALANWVDQPVDDAAPDPERRRKAKRRGLYRVDANLYLEPRNRVLTPLPAAGTEPYLLLLHGTFSHTEGAFGQLRGTPEWQRIAHRYEGRILALEHATLGLSPVENALMAAHDLPQKANLHLLSHSRGGLIGDSLSYAIHQVPALGAYPPDHPDLVAWRRLRTVATDRGLTIERFARVACPGLGTPLLANRLDKVGKILFNVFKLVPILRETGIAAVVQKFLSAVLEQRTDPRVIPGLEAQVPGSPLLRTLMTAQSGVRDGLGNITGDVEPRRVARRLLVWVSDLYYDRKDHDLVVPTLSMNGGITRTISRRAFFKGAEVDHSHYFSNLDSRAAVENWLAGQPDAQVENFRGEAKPGVAERTVRSAPLRPIAGEIILIPDVFGSVLREDGQPGWPDVAQMIRIGPHRAITGSGTSDAVDVVDDYRPLLDALRERYAVDGRPFDPRESLDGVAGDLRQVISDRLDAGIAPHLVAHGAGALVALAALTIGPEPLESRWRERGGRAVLLGPPFAGSPLIEARLAGRDELTAAVALLDGSATPADVGRWLQNWQILTLLRTDERSNSARRATLPTS